MNTRITLVLALAGLVLAGCEKEATVSGKSSEKLSLKEPSAVTLERGGTAKVDVDVTRRELPGDVAISFSGLPKGVDVIDANNKLVGEHGTYTLRASDTADLVEKSEARVTATGEGNIAVSQPLKVTVKAKK